MSATPVLSRRTLWMLLLCCFTTVGQAKESPFKSESPKPDAPGVVDVEPKAEKVLRQMSDFYKELKAASGNIAFLMKLEAPGVKREMNSKYEVSVERPNRFSVVLKEGVMGTTLVSNGKTVVTYLPAAGKFTEKPAPATLAEIFSMEDMLVVNQGIANLLLVDKLFSDKPQAALLEGVKSVQYVGLDEVNGVKAHHLALKQEEFDWDLWINDGKEPFVVKIKPDLGRALKAELGPDAVEGMKLDVQVSYENWTGQEKLAEERFAFKPPAGSEKVASLFTAVPDEANALLGKPAPPLNLELLGGGKIDMMAHRNKDIVVIDFWATWCGPCVQALPLLNEVAEAYRAKGVVAYVVDVREDRDTIKQFVAKKNFHLNFALDDDGAASELYGATGIPYTIVVGKDGTVQSVHVGLPPNFKERLSKELDTLLAGKSLVEQGAVEVGTQKKPE